MLIFSSRHGVSSLEGDREAVMLDPVDLARRAGVWAKVLAYTHRAYGI